MKRNLCAIREDGTDGRKLSRRKYQAEYRRVHREAAREMDRALGITRVAPRFQQLEPEEGDSRKSCYNESEVGKMDEDGSFEPVSEEQQETLYELGTQRFKLSAYSRKVCSVRDSLWPAGQIRDCEVGGNTAKKWVARLNGSNDVPAAHRRQYDVSCWVPLMRGALLSPRGLVLQKDRKPCGLLQVCSACYNSLTSSSKKPPKFAISNGFDVGLLPECFTHATQIERQMTSISSVAASVTVLRDGKHKALKGHVTIVTLDPEAISRKLPDVLREKQAFFVVMASKLTPRQKLLAMRKHKARRDVVYRLLDYYVSNNIVYQNLGVQIDKAALHSLEDDDSSAGGTKTVCQELKLDSDKLKGIDIFCGNDEGDDGLSAAVDEAKASMDPSESTMQQGEEEKYVEESYVSVSGGENTTIEILEAAKESLAVRNFGRLIPDFDKQLLAFAFPDLFPTGRGHPGTAREVKVSFEECIRYYLRLASRQFCRHPTFVFVAFDICAKRRVVSSTTVKSRNRPGEFEKIGNLSRDEVVAAIEAKKQQRKNMMQGGPHNFRESVVRPVRGTKLLKSVFASQSSMWGSSPERMAYRRKGFCMDAYLKAGAIFVTITPSEAGTMIVSILAGRTTVEEVQQMQNGIIPNRASRLEIATGDPVACAEYFELFCEGFFEVIVGFDMKRKQPYRGGGLFGVVKAYFGTIETQSSGTLHMHCILYVAGLPRTNNQFTRRCDDVVNDRVFKQRFKTLVDSIVSTSVPASPSKQEGIFCPNCKRSGGIKQVQEISRSAYLMRSASQHLFQLHGVNIVKPRLVLQKFCDTRWKGFMRLPFKIVVKI